MTESIGIFGGTFDPVHNGHLELARYAMNCCNLAKVIFIPAASPPHKTKTSVTPFIHRVEMIKLAIAANHGFIVSTVEQMLAPPNFTINTLRLFLDTRQKGGDYYFIIGMDAFLEIDTWKEAMKLLGSVNFIVAARKGHAAQHFYTLIEGFQYKKQGSFWYNEASDKKIYYLKSDIREISSSTIRENIDNNTFLADLICPDVLDYIRKHQLYIQKNQIV